MANTKTKTQTKSVAQKPKKEEVIVNPLDGENASLREQNKELKAQMDSMQAQINALLGALQQTKEKDKDKDGTCLVGSRIFNGATLASQNGDISIPVSFREEVEVSYSELREIFRNPFGYRTMFKKDMFYFVNEDDYKTFNIKKDVDLSDDALIEFLENNNVIQIIEKMKIMTKDKKDFMEMFTIIYQIAYLISTKKIDIDYEVRSALEKYFDVEFKVLINNLKDTPAL